MRIWLVLLSSLALASCGGVPRDDATPKEVAKTAGNVRLVFGEIGRVNDSPYFTLPIIEGRAGDSPYFSSYDGAREHNRLIVDDRTGRSRRVLPDHGRIIVKWFGADAPRYGYKVDDMPSQGEPAARLYAAVVADPRADDDQSPRRYDLLIGSFDSGEQVWASRSLDGIADVWARKDGSLAAIVTQQGRSYFRAYDAKTLSLITQTELKL